MQTALDLQTRDQIVNWLDDKARGFIRTMDFAIHREYREACENLKSGIVDKRVLEFLQKAKKDAEDQAKAFGQMLEALEGE